MNFISCPVRSDYNNTVICEEENCKWYHKNKCVVFAILDELGGIYTNGGCDVSSDVSSIESDISDILKILKNKK